jgi:hypothetical protein
MGICTLTFDQIQIINKKSDSRHSDNDWLIVNWFVGQGKAQTDTIALLNQTGSTILESGEALQPVSLSIACADTDLVTAAFQIVNLGSSDFSDQAAAAGDIGKKVSEALAQIYLKVAEQVVAASGIPLAEVFSAGLSEVEPDIVQSVGAAWDDILVPLVDDVVQLIQVLIGKPNCNGDVLHDLAMFTPDAPYTRTVTPPTYVASSKTGCGSPARTSIIYTMQRNPDPVSGFSNAPPPQTETAPEQGLSPAPWIGKWAEDPNTPTPHIFVDIEPSHRESGTLQVTITERIDPRFSAEFDGGGDLLLPQTDSVVIFIGNEFAQVKPRFSQKLKPGDLKVVWLPKPNLHPLSRRSDAAHQASQLRYALDWQRPSAAGGGTEIRSTMLGTKFGGGITPAFFEKGATIEIPTQGVTLFLYMISQNGNIIGNQLRYIRAENALYTRADVLLTRWFPLG